MSNCHCGCSCCSESCDSYLRAPEGTYFLPGLNLGPYTNTSGAVNAARFQVRARDSAHLGNNLRAQNNAHSRSQSNLRIDDQACLDNCLDPKVGCPTLLPPNEGYRCQQLCTKKCDAENKDHTGGDSSMRNGSKYTTYSSSMYMF